MLVFVVGLIIGGTSAHAASPQGVTKVVRTKAREQIRLPVKGKLRLRVDPMSGTLTLTSKSKATIRKLVERFFETPSALCPDFDATDHRIILRCQSRNLKAKITGKRRRRVLRVDDLLGPPLRKDDSRMPLLFYPPEQLGLGSKCPSNTDAGQGECHLRARRMKSAAKSFRKALKGEHRVFASLRLGDLAMEIGDVETAVGWYRKAGFRGPYGRLATLRLCELNGTCFDDRDHHYRYTDTAALRTPLKEEVVLRTARMHVFAGRPLQAAHYLLSTGLRTKSDNLCKYAPALCHRIALEALRTSQIQPSSDALSLYMALPGRLAGDHAFELTDLAAQTAEDLGALAFAASLLASSTEVVPDALAADHLYRTARLYVAADDQARARIVLRFAKEQYRKDAPQLLRFLLLEEQLDEARRRRDAEAALAADTPAEEAPALSPQELLLADAAKLLADAKTERTAPLYPPKEAPAVDGGVVASAAE